MGLNIAFGEIGNALKPVDQNHILGVADDIYDEAQEKRQSTINSELQAAVADKADASAVEELQGKLEDKADASAVSSLQSTVNGKADKSTVTSLQTAVTALESTVAGKADGSTVSSLQSTVNDKADKSTVEELQAAVEDKADASAVEELQGKLEDKADSSALSTLQSTVNGKADKSTVTSLQSTVTALESAVNGKADGSTVSHLEGIANQNSQDIDSLEANKADKTTVDTLQSQITALSLGAKATLTASPSTIYKGTATNVTLTGKSVNITADTIRILDGETVLKSGNDVSQLSVSQSVNISSSKTFRVEVDYNGMTLLGSATINAYYPIYCGMGSSPNSVAVDGNKLTARSSAVGTYTKTASGDNERLFLLVPTGVTCPTKFAMGGSPFAVTTTTMEINGIPYTVIESGGTYNSGTTVTVVAS